MNGFLQVFYVVFSAVITTLAAPNELLTFGSPILGMIALIPLFITLYNSKSFKIAGHLTGLQLFLTHLLSSFWLGNFKDFAIFTLGASAIAYYFFGFVFGNYLYSIFYYTEKNNPLKKFSVSNFKSPFTQILGFASIWTIYEWFKMTGWLAYPWGTLFMSCYKWHTLKQICSVTGVLGITYLMALFSSVVAKGILLLPDVNKFKANDISLNSYKLTAIYCMTLFIVSCAFGVHEYKKQPKIAKEINVVMVQHNGDSWKPNGIKNIETSIIETEKGKAELEAQGKRCDIAIWNESVLSLGWLPDALDKIYKVFPRNIPFVTYLENMKTPLLAGGPAHEKGDNNAQNAAVLFGKDGSIVDFYGKIHLVPFAEEIPYANTKIVQTLLKSLFGFSNGWTSGKNFVLFTITNAKGEEINFTTPVCFEDAFPDLCRALYNTGSDIFINITNDSWSNTKSAEYQHFVVSSFRTIEHKTTMIRSCTSGYSVVLNCNGDVIADMPLFEAAHLSTTVPIYERSNTIYSRYGNWIMAPIYLFIIFFFIIEFLRMLKEERNLQLAIQELYEENEIDDENQ